MLDGDLPLTPGEFKEWGSPREAGYFDYMRSYCPYENLNLGPHLLLSKRFPSVFCTTGLSDYRVGYYEGAKWIAKMRNQVREAKKLNKDFEEPLVGFLSKGYGRQYGRFKTGCG